MVVSQVSAGWYLNPLYSLVSRQLDLTLNTIVIANDMSVYIVNDFVGDTATWSVRKSYLYMGLFGISFTILIQPIRWPVDSRGIHWDLIHHFDTTHPVTGGFARDSLGSPPPFWYNPPGDQWFREGFIGFSSTILIQPIRWPVDSRVIHRDLRHFDTTHPVTGGFARESLGSHPLFWYNPSRDEWIPLAKSQWWAKCYHVDGLMQKGRNSIANALESCLFCMKPSMSWHYHALPAPSTAAQWLIASAR